ncbi:hypothetical protein ACHAQK_009876 [Fusarium lateritium]
MGLADALWSRRMSSTSEAFETEVSSTLYVSAVFYLAVYKPDLKRRERVGHPNPEKDIKELAEFVNYFLTETFWVVWTHSWTYQGDEPCHAVSSFPTANEAFVLVAYCLYWPWLQRAWTCLSDSG